MSPRARTLRYGASIGLTLVGVACGATLSGTLGGTLATALIGIGLVGIVSLVFYEVGLSEDRERAGRRSPVAPPAASPDRDQTPGRRSLGSRRLERRRGERRRLH